MDLFFRSFDRLVITLTLLTQTAESRFATSVLILKCLAMGLKVGEFRFHTDHPLPSCSPMPILDGVSVWKRVRKPLSEGLSCITETNA